MKIEIVLKRINGYRPGDPTKYTAKVKQGGQLGENLLKGMFVPSEESAQDHARLKLNEQFSRAGMPAAEITFTLASTE